MNMKSLPATFLLPIIIGFLLMKQILFRFFFIHKSHEVRLIPNS